MATQGNHPEERPGHWKFTDENAASAEARGRPCSACLWIGAWGVDLGDSQTPPSPLSPQRSSLAVPAAPRGPRWLLRHPQTPSQKAQGTGVSPMAFSVEAVSLWASLWLQGRSCGSLPACTQLLQGWKQGCRWCWAPKALESPLPWALLLTSGLLKGPQRTLPLEGWL